MPELATGQVTLKVGSQTWSGWETVRVETALGKLADRFTITVSDAWAAEKKQPMPRPVAAGSRCSLLLDGHTVITGWMDKPRIQRSGTSHSITFSARDATCDLEDCCVIQQGLSLAGLTLLQLAQKLCQPFGIGVKALADVGGAFPIANVEPGQKIFEVLDHLAKLRGLMLASDGLGNLLITGPGSTVAPVKIQMGINAHISDGYTDLTERYSDYYCFTQLAQGDSAQVTDQGLNMQGYAKDELMAAIRYRPFAFQGEMGIDIAYATQRAEWKRNVQAALSQQVTHTLQGWTHTKGLWRKNTLATVVDADFELDEQRLIASVNYLLDDQAGARVEIATVGKHAFDQLAVPAEVMLMELGQ